jgi:hypothetical protein
MAAILPKSVSLEAASIVGAATTIVYLLRRHGMVMTGSHWMALSACPTYNGEPGFLSRLASSSWA